MAKFKLFGKEGFFAKLGRRNLIIIGAIIAVGAAVWINYAVFYNPSQDVGYGDKNPSSDVGASEDENNAGDAVSTYFTSAQLSRQQAREEALAVLQTVVESEDALEATKTQALADIAQIAEEIRMESNVEALVKAKGYEACVAVLAGDKISVIVKCDDELAAAQVAQINEIVYSQTGIVPANVNIIRK